LLALIFIGFTVYAIYTGLYEQASKATPSHAPNALPTATPVASATVQSQAVESTPVETKEQFEARVAANNAEQEAKAMARAIAQPKWQYRNNQDEMGRGEVKQASADSLNTVNFDFPYSGSQRLRLMLRTHPKYGRDVILQVERGQFQTSFSEYGQQWRIAVRFDGGPLQEFTLRPAADGSANVAFVSGYDQFVTKLRKAKMVTIEAPFFHEGTRVFEFDVNGLEWK